MSINTTQIERELVPVFQGLFPAFVPDPTVDIRVIRGEQGKPRPDERTYIDIRTADFRQVGREGVHQADAGTDLTKVEANYRLELRVRSIGPRAKEAISTVQFGLNRPDILDAFESLATHPLALSDDQDIIHIPLLTETEWEERSQMVVVFFLQTEEDIDLGTIEKLDDLTGTFEGASSSPINTSTGPIDRNA
jgi:hypothetical protein